MFQVNQIHRQLSKPCVTITVTQNNCCLSVCLLGTQICLSLALLSYHELASQVRSSLGSIQNLSVGKQNVEAIICIIHPRNMCASAAPEITCLKKKKKVFKAIILVSIDSAGMFQRIVSNFGSSSLVLFNQG